MYMLRDFLHLFIKKCFHGILFIKLLPHYHCPQTECPSNEARSAFLQLNFLSITESDNQDTERVYFSYKIFHNTSKSNVLPIIGISM